MSFLGSSAHSRITATFLRICSVGITPRVRLNFAGSRRIGSILRFNHLSPKFHSTNMDPNGVKHVTIEGRRYRAVTEGLAEIVAPFRDTSSTERAQPHKRKSHNNDEGDQAVFYNPIQQYNRDLSVLAILTYAEGAVAEKKERLERKQPRSGTKDKKQSQVTANGRKRKAGDIDDNVTGTKPEAKKIRLEESEDEGLEVKELQNRQSNGTAVAQGELKDKKSLDTPTKVPFTILDALSASGLRAIRYAKEIPLATRIVANDLSQEAVKSIELNIDHNKVNGIVSSNVGDARAYMYSKVGSESRHTSESHVHRFDVIDLDPYGTAAPFLDAAVQALTDGGMLCVTCTDAGVFASNGYPEKAYSLYGGVTMKGHHSHEAGLRLILHAVATSAAKYGIAIEPLLSLSIDFYARLFIRVHKKQSEVKFLAGTTMITYSCDHGCGAWTTQLIARNKISSNKAGNDFFKHTFAQAPSTSTLCDHCNSKMHLCGPMWAGPIHNPYFVQKILNKLPGIDESIYGTVDRLKGMLTIALGENLTLAIPDEKISPSAARLDIIPRLPPESIDKSPFFFIPNPLAKVLHCVTPPDEPMRSAIRELGYKVTRSHCKPGSFKTDAPWSVLWEIMREWIRQKYPVKEGKIPKGTAGWTIMSKARGTKSKRTYDCAQEIQRAIAQGVEAEEQLRTLLESGLYRLQHKTGHNPEDGAATDVQEGEVLGTERSPGSSSEDTSKLKIVFDSRLGKEKSGEKLVRYQVNPRANWGPMNRAG